MSIDDTRSRGGGDWDRPDPHILRRDVTIDDTDAYAHVNNAVYLGWLDLAAWSHSTALGVPTALCLQLRRGMVVYRVALQYEKPAFAGDQLEIGTWIVSADGRLRSQRQFQIRRPRDSQTLLRGWIDYVCTNLDSGRATRMPPQFVAAYRAAGVMPGTAALPDTTVTA